MCAPRAFDRLNRPLYVQMNAQGRKWTSWIAGRGNVRQGFAEADGTVVAIAYRHNSATLGQRLMMRVTSCLSLSVLWDALRAAACARFCSMMSR